jgi:DNA-binding NarL/FixJ family response regulator
LQDTKTDLRQVGIAEPDAVRCIAIVEYEGHGMDGIELAAKLKEISATIEVLLYTGVSSPYALQRIFHSKIAGCVLKTEALCELGQGVETIRGHHRFRSRAITGRCEEMENGRALLGTLTCCEMETLRLTCAGMSVKEIASHRGVSGKTVDTQRSHIFAKLHVQSALEAVAFAYRNGLIEP